MTESIQLDTFHQMDGIEMLEALPPSSVHLIVIDPPYGTTQLSFETLINWKRFWSAARRALVDKHCSVISFSQQPFTTDLITSNRKAWRLEIIWHKTMPVGFLDAPRRPLRTHENIEIFSDAAPYYYPQMKATGNRSKDIRTRHTDGHTAHYGKHSRLTHTGSEMRYPRSVWTYAQRNSSFQHTKTNHPTEKPVALIEELIANFALPGQTVVDCFCGSGSTALAARNRKCHFVCSDNGIDEKTGLPWVDISRERMRLPFEDHIIIKQSDLSGLPLFD